MDSVFITGATGFVGANLARLLIEKGFRVKALARKGSDRGNLKGVPLEIVEGDLLDKSSLLAGTAGTRYVFHVAADYRLWVPDPRSLYAANVDGTVNVIEAAARSGVERIVHCSSVAAIKPPEDHSSADEESHYTGPEEVVSDYKKSKFLGERAALELAGKGLPVVVVNPSAPMGPYDIKPTPTGRVLVDFMNGNMPSYIDTGLNIVDVRDVALGHILAAQKGRIGERYILGGENLTFKQILQELSRITGQPVPLFKTPYAVALLFAAADTALAKARGTEPRAPLDAVRMARHYMWYTSDKARRELGYSPRPVREALQSAVAWFCSNGYTKGPLPGAKLLNGSPRE